MIWIFFACSSANYKMSAEMDEAQEDYFADSGDFETAEEGVEPNGEDLSMDEMEEAKWWKLSADLVLVNDAIEINLQRDLYSENMDLLCEQTLTIDRVLQFDSPFGGDERWFSVNLGEIQDTDCPYTRSETEFSLE